MGFRDTPVAQGLAEVKNIAERFRVDVESFYAPEAIQAGHIIAKDLGGREARFALMTVSTVVLELPRCINRICSVEEIGNHIDMLKKEAKGCEARIRVATLQHFSDQSHGVWCRSRPTSHTGPNDSEHRGGARQDAHCSAGVENA